MKDSGTVSALYKSLVDAGTVIDDVGQKSAVAALDNLYKQINSSYIKNIFSNNKNIGVYIYGPVGRGKSYLMDIFYKLAQNKRCMRVHQYNFMQNLYKYMKEAASSNNKNPLKFATEKLTKDISLLCIDEFEVLDIADAMILERIFTVFYKKNIKLVLTSNTKPNNLYKDGLQRERFLPFIDMIKKFMVIEEVLDGKDYRIKQKISGGIHEFQNFYFLPANIELIENLFNKLRNNFPIQSITLEFNSRKLFIDKISNNVGFFTFSKICDSNFSSIDYIQISKNCDWVIISDIPKLSVENRNLAKRFQMLIDILYDKKIGLSVSSNVKPEDIYIEGDGHKEFRRTVSRVYEMTHKEWINKIKNKDFKILLNL